MRLSSVLAIKDSIFSELKEESELQLGTYVQGLVHPKIEARLAVGYSKIKKSNYQLELRVQRGKGTAYRRALELKEMARGEANIEVVPVIEVPPRKKVPEKGRVRLTQRVRPLEIGISIGHLDGGAGTLGAFVELKDGRPAILSNNHVMARFNKAELGDYIYQPGQQDVRRQLARNRIARLHDFVPLSRTLRNHVDSAIALIRDDVTFRGNIIPSGVRHSRPGELLKLGNPLKLPANTVVSKIGRTTGFRQGLVKAIALDNVPVRTPIGNLLFDDTIEIEWLPDKKPFSKPGDSGSLVFIEEDLAAIGLHFAGGQIKRGAKRIGVSYSCNIRTVLEDYGASLMEYAD
jgi:hypothetical protein